MDAAPQLRTPVHRKMRGLFVATLVALFLSAVKDFGPDLIETRTWPSSFLGFYLVVGFVVSLMVCGALGNLAWHMAEDRGLHKLTHAAWIGAAGGLVVVLVEMPFVAEILTSAGKNSRPGEAIALVAGLVWTIITGALTGLAARLAAGPPEPEA